MKNSIARLGVNIDHVASIRQMRGTAYPCLLSISKDVEDAGADQITVHLREDRRHIQDGDVIRLRSNLRVLLNLEMAATEEMFNFARKVKPDWICIVPEKREEKTTEGGLDLRDRKTDWLSKQIRAVQDKGIKVSLFVEPDSKTIRMAGKLRANAVELHTGQFALKFQSGDKRGSSKEILRVRSAIKTAQDLSLGIHAGHGLDTLSIRPLVELELIEEFNVGHSIVARALSVGMKTAVKEMLAAIQAP